MTISQIESNIQNLIKSFSKETFVYNFLLSFGLPKSSITRLQKGALNLSKNKNEIIWKKKLYFKSVGNEDLHLTITEMVETSKHNERFIIVTDYRTLLAIDSKTNERLDIDLKDLPKHYDFFLPLAGMEKTNHQDENPADVKAAEKMAKLFDEIRKDNPSNSPDFLHSLNVFLSRLLFCFFADDTNIFTKGQFSNTLDSHTQADGSDLNEFFDKLFEVLNTPQNKRKSFPEYLSVFPYVNGGLFRDKIISPKFTKSSRRTILNSGDQIWSSINPDIFGSMFQAVVSEDQRGNLGQHYTSVPNIMKVIKPLFLDELYEAFEKAKGKEKHLKELIDRIRKIKIFDPACGSGNFLIIAYKELRKLEIKIFKELDRTTGTYTHHYSTIALSQFYGIEIDDFAHEIAKLSLWLAEHQMNIAFFKEFGKTNPTLPLKEAGKIVCANATRIDWEKVCPKEKEDEIYVLGNPPYAGYAKQSQSQKRDMTFSLSKITGYKKLDFISCWFYYGYRYIKSSNSKLAFVTTNSLTQGEQVCLLWPYILDANIEINFAYTSFKWTNNAKYNAGVSVVIIGLMNKTNGSKLLYSKKICQQVESISPYLTASKPIYIQGLKSSISDLPQMIKGSQASDNGLLTLSEIERNIIIKKYPNSINFIKKYIGNKDYMSRRNRFCIWVDEDKIAEALKISEFRNRFEKVREFRLASEKEATRNKAATPYLFDERKYQPQNSIVVPQTGSERRDYLPVGFIEKDIVVSNGLRIVYGGKPYLFSLLSSKIHIVWVKAVAGRMKTDMQYSNTICYNTFPFPVISDQRKQELTQTAFRILEEREKHSDKTLAELYDPDKMPDGLREAHHLNDLAVERCYRSKPFESDEERLEYLFQLYEQMISEEQDRDTLFAIEKKIPKRKKK